ncbi:E3 SUMO-protein ligase ZBED1 [Frankliniella fusca]|uniref:E3 SUMO-protein ligase ZBED1 n=1 Tax=Frankliniella fusca TaxID=407009 RepID=A0AAE1HAL8_9NEOP|nr:E3 SUMO-protein ligase ZBED1 [Frankliniella fusca]
MITHLKTHDVVIAKQPAKGGRKRRSALNSTDDGNETENEDDPNPDDNDFEPSAKRLTPTRSKVQTLEACVSNINSFALIVKDNLPLRTPEKPGFQKFSNTLQPLYKIPSEPTMTRFIQDKYKALQARVQNMILRASHITLAMDLWTHKNTLRNHLGMTCCLTKDSKSTTVELGCRVMDEKKTAENVAAAIDRYCEDWKIDKEKSPIELQLHTVNSGQAHVHDYSMIRE